MKVLWAIVCEGISVDRQTNNISLFNVIEQMRTGALAAPAEPNEDHVVLLGTALNMKLVVLWDREDLDRPESGEGRMVVAPPAGEPAHSNAYPVDLNQFQRRRVISGFPGFPARGAGIYRLIVESRNDDNREWQSAFELPIQVTVDDEE